MARNSASDSGKNISVWADSVGEKRGAHPSLDGDIETQVLVVGAGLAGLLTAWRLKQAGIPYKVVEAKTVGSGITQNTTGKISAQHGLLYADLIKRFGEEKARLYYKSNTRAIKDFRDISKKFPCDLENKTAYVYSIDDRSKLEREKTAYSRLGIKGDIGESSFLPFANCGTISMENQAQFNPIMLLSGLAEQLDILEHTLVKDVEGDSVITDKGTIRAEHIVLCSHFPLINIPGLYFLKLYQHRSYVLGLENAPLPDGMYLDERMDGHSFRSYGNILLVGGGDHRTGKKGGQYAELLKLKERAFPEAAVKYRWSAQDCMSLDSVPYIGRHRGSTAKLYVASGFNKWGMTGSMVASRLISELILDGESQLEELYSPKRSPFTKQLAANTGEAVAGLISPGKKCTHMGCKLHKNLAEGTWECSCHGSRYDKDGHLLDNPAKRDLRI